MQMEVSREEIFLKSFPELRVDYCFVNDASDCQYVFDGSVCLFIGVLVSRNFRLPYTMGYDIL
jgi:hypothetical protein